MMQRIKKGLAIRVLCALLATVGFVHQIYPYCFLNNSDIKTVKVLTFKNNADLKSYLTATGWTEKVINNLLAICNLGGKKAIRFDTTIDIEALLGWLGNSLKHTDIKHWLAKLTEKIEFSKYFLKSQSVEKGQKACFAWSEIANKIKDPKQKTAPFLVVDPNNTVNPIVFAGTLNFGCGLALEGKGKLAIYYPFLDSDQKVHLLPMPEGEARGYALPANILPQPDQAVHEGVTLTRLKSRGISEAKLRSY